MNRTANGKWTRVLAVAATLVAAGGAARGQSGVEDNLLRGARNALNLRAAQLIYLELDVDQLEDFDVVLPIDGFQYTASLAFKSLRAPGFKLLVQVAGGEMIEQDPGPVRSLRGELLEDPGSILAGSLLEDGLYLMVQFGDGERFWMEPLFGKVEGAQPEHHLIYRDADILGSGGWCKVLPNPEMADGHPHDHDEYGSVAGTPNHIAELACDSDVQYFQTYGSVAATQNQITNIINTMNVQYQNQTNITHLITAIIVRTTEPDGYTSTNPETMLNEVFNQWNGKFPEIKRDVVQFFTGKNMNGSTIGIAWLGVVCKNLKYSAVESNCFGCGSFGCKTDLSAHELGHNWNAGHCCAGTTMASSLTCANNFAATSINQITAYKNTILSCLDLGNKFLRIIVSGPSEVNEGTSAKYTSMAQYQFGPDVDVSNQTQWSVIPGTAGSINNQGLFTAAQVTGNQAATIKGFYVDASGDSDDHQMAITVIDLDAPPDPRKVNMVLSPSVAPNSVCSGQSFDVDVRINALNGNIIDIRQLQFDTSLTSGLTINSVEWVLEGLVDKSLYFLVSTPPVLNAVYVGLSGFPGFIVHFDATQKVMLRVNVTFHGGVGSLNLCGVVNPPTTDFSVRFQSEFNPPIEFTQALDNVVCGGLAFTEGSFGCDIKIIASNPPTDTIDARQPFEPDGSNPAGFSFVDLVFDGPADQLTPADFSVLEDGGDGIPPTVIAVQLTGVDSVRVFFNQIIQVGAWTQLIHDASGTSVTIGYLPGDVNGDQTAAVPDVLALIDHLNAVISLPITSTDIDRSGVVGAPDVLRVIDLLNGAGAYPVFNGMTLP